MIRLQKNDLFIHSFISLTVAS